MTRKNLMYPVVTSRSTDAKLKARSNVRKIVLMVAISVVGTDVRVLARTAVTRSTRNVIIRSVNYAFVGSVLSLVLEQELASLVSIFLVLEADITPYDKSYNVVQSILA
jgi:hypothetical protein